MMLEEKKDAHFSFRKSSFIFPKTETIDVMKYDGW